MAANPPRAAKLHGEFVLEGHLVDDVLMACRLDGHPPTA